MSKLDKALQVVFDNLTDDQLDRKVTELRQTIPQLNMQLDYAASRLRERRHAAAKKALDDSRRSTK